MPSEPASLNRPRISLVSLWILFCAFCSFIGWILSALGQLNAGGYVVAFALSVVVFFVWRGRTGAMFPRAIRLRKWRWRYRHAFPLGCLILGTLAILGGVIHPPTNYDALAYRTPRVLHWLAEGRWHWIHTDFHRLNVRGCATEWVTAPIFALARTDRFEFLISAISFVLLPGRVFGIWTRLGVRPRVAWQWMWLLPTGYCYLLQAGSIANDLFGAVFALTAIEFALRARSAGRLGDLLISILSAALMTSGKAFNLLLLLPWMVAAGPALKLLLRRPSISGFALMIAASVSLLPTAIINCRYCGDWTGQKAEGLVILGNTSPAFRVAINAILIPLHNFAPPVFPFSNAWGHLMQQVISPPLAARIAQNFEGSAVHLSVEEMQMEESAGLGFGLSVLLVIVLLYRWRHRSKMGSVWARVLRGVPALMWMVSLAAWVSLLVFMSQAGLGCPARYLSPFYPLLMVPIIAGNGPLLQLCHKVWWRVAGVLVFLIAALPLILSPPRPLWPAMTVLKSLGAESSSRPLVQRAWMVYSVYSDRADAFAPALAVVPGDANPLGLVTGDDPETSLWRPFGSRRIEHVTKEDDAASIRRRGIKYVLVSSAIVTHLYGITIDEWLKKYDGEVVQPLTLTLRAHYGPVQWYLVRVRE